MWYHTYARTEKKHQPIYKSTYVHIYVCTSKSNSESIVSTYVIEYHEIISLAIG